MTRNPCDLSRRHVLGGALSLAGVAGLNLPAFAQAAKPKNPLSINIIDAAGNLALTQPAFDNYRRSNPDLIARMTFTKATSPELPSKIRAQQGANRVDIDLVIIGPDALSAGLADDIYLDLVGNMPSRFLIFKRSISIRHGVCRNSRREGAWWSPTIHPVRCSNTLRTA